jgi:beta-glucosidase
VSARVVARTVPLALLILSHVVSRVGGAQTSADARVEAILAKLTLEQKIDLIGGVDPMFIREVPSAGWPQLKMSDGPLGVRTWGPTTGYAAGIALAAAWDPELAQRVGASIGRDARARGVHFLLGPGVNIYRAPMNGRNFEYFGEDPFLAARTTVGYITGVQGQGVIATVKHFAANNSEYDRHRLSSDMDERTLREIYLPAFEAAVREAHVGAIMDSYNLLNGVHLTQNAWLNDSIAKHEWGFDGIMMSDWDATYDGVAAANAGLDLEMPWGKFMNRATLLPAVQQGTVTTATIDDKVRRILRTAIRFGFLDHDQTDLGIPAYSRAASEVALQSARESIVLLKNDGNALPLDATRARTIAVIGPDAWPARASAGGSATIESFAPVSILQGITDYLGDSGHVLYVRGLPSAMDLYENTVFHVDTAPNVVQEPLLPRDVMTTTRWAASFTPDRSGMHLVLVEGDCAYRLTIDDALVYEERDQEGHTPHWVELPLTAGRPVHVQLAFTPRGRTVRAGLGIRSMATLVDPEAARIASRADAAIVAVGFDPSTEGEGTDRTFALPFGQDALIEAVAAANKRTVVTVTAGGNVAMDPWIDHVPAVLHTWYPGQEGGTAVAQVLFGATDPEGRLPVSFERRWEDNPTHDSYYPTSGVGTAEPHVTYSEGVFVGYRYYVGASTKPRFPFGYGLSYTTFAFSHLAATPRGVSFDVTNTGAHAGAAVAEVYIGDPSARVKRPAKELKGFKKVRLAPGETRHVELPLDARAFAYWDIKARRWRTDPGRFVVYLGDSSENTPLTATVMVSASSR